MSLWYLPHCPSNDAGNSLYQKIYKSSTILNDNRTTSYTILNIAHSECRVVANFSAYANNDCKLTEKQIQSSPKSVWSNLLVGQRSNMITYCIDVATLYNKMAEIEMRSLRNNHENSNDSTNRETPILSQWGDKLPDEEVGSYFPPLVKWRPRLEKLKLSQAISEKDCWPRWRKRTFDDDDTVTPIIWSFGSARHLRPVRGVLKYDIKWRYKKPLAVLRGSFTGIGNSDSTVASPPNATMIEICHSNQRCNFAYQYSSHPLVDIGFDSTLGYMNSTLLDNGKTINVLKPRLQMQQLMEYKMLTSFEGNDVATGLK